jgi:hypothetical protein
LGKPVELIAAKRNKDLLLLLEIRLTFVLNELGGILILMCLLLEIGEKRVEMRRAPTYCAAWQRERLARV